MTDTEEIKCRICNDWGLVVWEDGVPRPMYEGADPFATDDCPVCRALEPKP
jgi:hypothetical protein